MDTFIKIRTETVIDTRIKYLIINMLDIREKGWNVNKKDGPQTKKQLRQEILREQEEAERPEPREDAQYQRRHHRKPNLHP